MSRTRLPNRRFGETFDVEHPTGEVFYSVMIGRDWAGDVKECFISSNKSTSAMDIAARDIATLISIALQHGASIQELAAAMTRGDQGEPQGAAGAVLDAIAGIKNDPHHFVDGGK